jgi:hypothetical protein
VLLVSTQKTLRGSTMTRPITEFQLLRKLDAAVVKMAVEEETRSSALNDDVPGPILDSIAFCNRTSTNRNNSLGANRDML